MWNEDPRLRGHASPGRRARRAGGGPAFGHPASLRMDIGLLIHLPVGTGTCEAEELDLELGWRVAQLAVELMLVDKAKDHCHRPFAARRELAAFPSGSSRPTQRPRRPRPSWHPIRSAPGSAARRHASDAGTRQRRDAGRSGKAADGSELAPLARDVGAQRACSSCGRWATGRARPSAGVTRPRQALPRAAGPDDRPAECRGPHRLRAPGRGARAGHRTGAGRRHRVRPRRRRDRADAGRRGGSPGGHGPALGQGPRTSRARTPGALPARWWATRCTPRSPRPSGSSAPTVARRPSARPTRGALGRPWTIRGHARPPRTGTDESVHDPAEVDSVPGDPAHYRPRARRRWGLVRPPLDHGDPFAGQPKDPSSSPEDRIRKCTKREELVRAPARGPGTGLVDGRPHHAGAGDSAVPVTCAVATTSVRLRNEGPGWPQRHQRRITPTGTCPSAPQTRTERTEQRSRPWA
jgi:hypothetical protein